MKKRERTGAPIILYCDPETTVAQETLAFLEAAKARVEAVNLREEPMTEGQLLHIASGLRVVVSELVRKDHPEYQDQAVERRPTSLDCLKMMVHNPQTIRQPIAVRDEEMILVETPADLEPMLGH